MSQILIIQKENILSIEERKSKMGCEPSKKEDDDILSMETAQEFKLQYRQLVSQDRGQIFDLYHFSSIISRSSYSIVRRVISRGSQQSRICKIIPLTNKDYFSVLSQVEFLKKLDHPNIIQIIEYFIQSSFLYIIFEQIPGGKILTELNQIKNRLDFEDIVQIMKQVLSAVDFCHRKQIAHRTLGPDNILLIQNHSMFIVKLIDFSQACVLDCPKPKPIIQEKRCMKLNNYQYSDSQMLDLFDCGFLFYCLLLGKKPMQPQLKQILPNCFQLISKLQLPQQISLDMKKLLTDMLNINSIRKIQFSQILNYDFFKHFNKKVEAKKAITNLLEFNTDDNLKYLLSMYGSLNMTSSAQKSQFMMEFYNLDKNKDGQIQLEQLTQGIMNTFNVNSEKAITCAQRIFEKLDKNKNGSLNFSQFVTGTMRISKLLTHEFLQAMFKEMDLNKDGFITQSELNNLIAGIDKHHLLKGKKQVSFNEFKQIMLKMLKPSDPNKETQTILLS